MPVKGASAHHHQQHQLINHHIIMTLIIFTSLVAITLLSFAVQELKYAVAEEV